VLDSLDSDPYAEMNDLAYEHRRLSDSWQSHMTWQSDHPDGASDGAMERASFSRSSMDSSWTGSSLPSTFSVASHDFNRPGMQWNDMQTSLRSSNSISRMSSWSWYQT
jgi:hypothetical protein